MSKQSLIFIDTNILVYQFDKTAPQKQRRAIELIEQHLLDRRAVVSSQVVQEFTNVALRKFQQPLSVPELKLVYQNLLQPLCKHTPNFSYYERALGLWAANSISYYDALIIQAALDLQCHTLYSEDLQDGQQFGHLLVRNPFADSVAAP